jgi:hypothetical protein
MVCTIESCLDTKYTLDLIGTIPEIFNQVMIINKYLRYANGSYYKFQDETLNNSFKQYEQRRAQN